jgi:hypothetical protein
MPPFELPPEWREMIRRAQSFRLSPEIREAIENAAKYEIQPAMREAAARAAKFEMSPTTRDALAVALEGAAEQARRASEAWHESFARVIAPTIEQWRLQLPKVQTWAANYGPVLAKVGQQIRDAWRAAMPPNWVDLSAEEVQGAIDRVRDTGFCLVWLPRLDIVRAVLASTPEDTATVLLAHRDQVLDDAERTLADCSQPELELEREAASDAIEALRSGRPRPAQALASSVFTSAIHVFFQVGKTRKIRKLMEDEDPEDAAFSELRLRTIYLAGASALSAFRPERAWPVPRRFNRHNTAHRITREQWTEENALAAVMVAVGLLRELDFWLHLASERDQAEAEDPG